MVQAVLNYFKDFKTQLEKRGYKQSEFELIMQETLSVNKMDRLKKQKKKKQFKGCTNM